MDAMFAVRTFQEYFPSHTLSSRRLFLQNQGEYKDFFSKILDIKQIAYWLIDDPEVIKPYICVCLLLRNQPLWVSTQSFHVLSFCMLQLHRSYQTVIHKELPIVNELTAVVREWGKIWKRLYVVSSDTITSTSLLLIFSCTDYSTYSNNYYVRCLGLM